MHLLTTAGVAHISSITTKKNFNSLISFVMSRVFFSCVGGWGVGEDEEKHYQTQKKVKVIIKRGDCKHPSIFLYKR
jgi:hypothetical protein